MAQTNKPSIEDLQAQIAEKEARIAELEAALDKSQATGVVSIPIPGTFSAQLENAVTGEKVRKKVKFKDGRRFVVLHPTGEKAPSALVMKLANGKELTEEEKKNNPVLQDFSKGDAKQLMEHYISIHAGFLQEL
jgi:predicted RNase H-like nuclease (RuvC/YqgF family)